MIEKKFVVALLAPFILVVAFLCFIFFISFGFENKEQHNGVGWHAFSKNLKKHIESTDFQITEFGKYDGKIWFGDLVSGHRSIQFGMFTRGNFEDPRNLQTLKQVWLVQIGDESISCTDNDGRFLNTSASIWKMDLGIEPGRTSIAKILEMYDPIKQIVSSYEGGTYQVIEGEVQALPDWMLVDLSNACCSKSRGEVYAVEQVKCFVAEREN